MRFYVHGSDDRFEAVAQRFRSYGVGATVCNCFCQGGTGLLKIVYVKPAQNDEKCWTKLKEIVERHPSFTFNVIANDQLQIARMRNIVGGRGNLSYMLEAEFGEEISVRIEMAKSRMC